MADMVGAGGTTRMDIIVMGRRGERREVGPAEVVRAMEIMELEVGLDTTRVAHMEISTVGRVGQHMEIRVITATIKVTITMASIPTATIIGTNMGLPDTDMTRLLDRRIMDKAGMRLVRLMRPLVHKVPSLDLLAG